MTLKEKVKLSYSLYREELQKYDFFISGSVVNNIFNDNTNIEIVIYDEDASNAYDYIRNLYNSKEIQLESEETFIEEVEIKHNKKLYIINFKDIYKTNQRVFIYITNKEKTERDKTKIITFGEFLQL